MNILIFDMDGVLLEPNGYHRALVETVRRIGCALGFNEPVLSDGEIASFEAAGITSEWHSSAVCVALMLLERWKSDPRAALPDLLTSDYPTNPQLPPPHFGAFARSLTRADWNGLAPLQRVERMVLDPRRGLSSSQTTLLQTVLRRATIYEESLSYRTFQEFVLGSQVYARYYPLPAVLDTQSYLQRFDHPKLSSLEQIALNRWGSQESNAVVIMTLRPSQAPGDTFCTPEAEMGAQRAGLEDVPIAGYGCLLWLSERWSTNTHAFGKPSPVHALAALRLALGDRHERAFLSSARLVREEQVDGLWEKLDGARVSIFEDSTNGLESVLAAQGILKGIGIHLEVRLLGITADPAKRESLAEVATEVYPGLSEALAAEGVTGG